MQWRTVSFAFRQGVKEVGFTEGENVTILYRWAENRVDHAAEMAAELARRQVAVIVTTGGPSAALAAKADRAATRQARVCW